MTTEAEAIARLRAMVARHDEHAGLHDEPDGGIDDLRTLLDAHVALEAEFKARAGEWADAQRVFLATEAAHAEALDALEGLADNVRFLDVEFCDDEEEAEAEAVLGVAQAVLAKAGRR